ncbi:LTXXQ motif family protein [Desulfuromusa kysingii]|uniref:LTXXQ motif family protein n=1 Tax=Desulfuromusa kysingii TaxID=37625 RepID=A0A1H4DI72_9BACT|nr:Spy/CpxP family protein refolding chaperone [Desulfuromusa kysingii]SEA72159.1 LTXXQ motif family protein [Desulfuromusa kysingii]
MKKTAILPMLLITLLLSAGTAFSWPGQQGQRDCDNSCNRQGKRMNVEQHEQRMENRLAKMAIILDLTETQQKEIKGLVEKQWQDRQSMRAEMQTSRDDLRAYKQGKEFDESVFRAKAQKLADLKTEMMVQQAKSRQALFAVLTPEQQQKAEKLRAMHADGFFGRDHARPGDCDGQGRRGEKGNGSRWNN